MALWMEAGAEPKTESEIADLEAITALKGSAALELKDKGNEYVKLGKKHYPDAIDCYTRAINQKVLSDAENSILFSNRAHVNLLLGNFRCALKDAEESIKLNSNNVKAFYRAAKASLFLEMLPEAKLFCENGLKIDPNNEELQKLGMRIESQLLEHQKHKAEVSNAITMAKDLVSAIEDRKLKIGNAMYQELTGLRKPVLDKNKILHWPVLLLYAEVMSSDFIEDFPETDMFTAHLDMMFSEGSPPLTWDKDNNYTRDAIELYYEAGSGIPLSRGKVLQYFLEGTAGANVELKGDDEDVDSNPSDLGSSKWVKVNEKRTLNGVLKEPKIIIPGIPASIKCSNLGSGLLNSKLLDEASKIGFHPLNELQIFWPIKDTI